MASGWTAPDLVAPKVKLLCCKRGRHRGRIGDKAADEKAAAILADLYPDREIVMLNIDAVGEVGGGIHCATHEQPKV